MEHSKRNFGDFIVRLAVWLLAIEIAGAIIGGIAYMFVSESALLGLLFIIIGGVVAIVSFSLMAGFGALLSLTYENTKCNKEILQILKEMEIKEDQKECKEGDKPASFVKPAQPEQPADNIVNNATTQPIACEAKRTSKDIPVVAEIVDGLMVCPSCGRSQKADRHVCWNCGQKFDN